MAPTPFLLLGRQEQGRDPVLLDPAGIAGMDQIDFIGSIYEGGGLELWWEFYQKELKLNLVYSRSCLRARRRSVGSSGRSRTSPISRA